MTLKSDEQIQIELQLNSKLDATLPQLKLIKPSYRLSPKKIGGFSSLVMLFLIINISQTSPTPKMINHNLPVVTFNEGSSVLVNFEDLFEESEIFDQEVLLLEELI